MTGKRLYASLALGLVVYAGALVATAPAASVAGAVEALSQRRLVLREPTGSAWTGSGRLYARQPSGELAELGLLAWKAFPASLARGSLRGELRVGKSERPMLLELGLASLTVHDLDVELPGEALGSASPALHNLGPQGRIRVRSEKLQLDRDSVLGLAEVEWRQMRVAHPQEIELGSHVARLRGGGGKVDIELGTLEGPLKLAGRGAWTREGGFSVAGSAEPHAPRLAAFLKSVCADYQQSRCSFRYPK